MYNTVDPKILVLNTGNTSSTLPGSDAGLAVHSVFRSLQRIIIFSIIFYLGNADGGYLWASDKLSKQRSRDLSYLLFISARAGCAGSLYSRELT